MWTHALACGVRLALYTGAGLPPEEYGICVNQTAVNLCLDRARCIAGSCPQEFDHSSKRYRSKVQLRVVV